MPGSTFRLMRRELSSSPEKINTLKNKYARRLYLSGSIILLLFLGFIISDLLYPVDYSKPYSCSIYDKNDKLVHAFLSVDDKWRLFCELDEISIKLKRAIIQKEDKYFYYHPGINGVAIARALYNNIINAKRTSGASTITMQVARLLEPKQRTYGNKFKEMFRALQLEWHLSKEEILQLYLNLVPMGGNIEGIKAASFLYFNKAPNYLSLAEITTLSIIPNRPVSLRLGRNNLLIEQERNKWLNRFNQSNTFDEQEIEDALNEPLSAFRQEMPRLAPHLSRRLKKLYPAKNIIKSSIDLNMQLTLEKLVKAHNNQLYYKGIYNATALVMDNKSRQVLAYIGSADFNATIDAGQVDGIIAPRSPGSTLKPFLYAMAMDKGVATPKKKLLDIPTYFTNYEPENYDGKFYGEVSLEFALINSLNVPAVRLLDKLGTEEFIELLAACGCYHIAANTNRLGLSVVLGGCGVTLEELTTAYCALANHGAYTNAKYLSADTLFKTKSVVSPAAAFATAEILTKLTRPDLPSQWRNTMRMPKIAWKTGTSYGRRDAWSIGFNQQYTIGVWCGNFSGKGIPELSGSSIATPLLLKAFNSLKSQNHSDWMLPPDDLDYRNVCTKSGMVPGQSCTDLIIDTYIPSVSSIKKCNHLKQIWINADSTRSYCSRCLPESGYKKILVANDPPEVISYYYNNNIPFAKIPAHNPACEVVSANNAPLINAPINNMEYLISKSDTAQLKLECKTTAEINIVYWSVNDKFYKSAPASTPVYITPPPGTLKISCADDLGRNSDIHITVKFIDF